MKISVEFFVLESEVLEIEKDYSKKYYIPDKGGE